MIKEIAFQTCNFRRNYTCIHTFISQRAHDVGRSCIYVYNFNIIITLFDSPLACVHSKILNISTSKNNMILKKKNGHEYLHDAKCMVIRSRMVAVFVFAVAMVGPLPCRGDAWARRGDPPVVGSALSLGLEAIPGHSYTAGHNASRDRD